MANPIIAPSVLSADFSDLKSSFNLFHESNADWVHVDIMDGRFVPNISFGFPVMKAMRKLTDKFFDVHLMIVEPEKYLSQFKDAGADQISVHIETSPHLHRTIEQINQLGLKAGVAINPHTPINTLENILSYIDIVCLMSVNPGFGGQSFIEETYQKISQLVELRDKTNSKALIEIDGGVTLQNAKKLLQTGADVLVAGSAIFKTENPIATANQFKSIQI